MKLYIEAVSALLLVSSLRAGAVLSTYNLVTSPGLATFHSGINPGIISSPQQSQSVAHPAVVENALAEAQLSPELINPFYKNPVIAEGLAKESWFANKEFPVHHRDADHIDRSEIFKIISRLQNRRK